MTGDIDGFAFRLARDLGMTVAQMNRAMTHSEYVGWRAYYVFEAAMQRHAADVARGH